MEILANTSKELGLATWIIGDVHGWREVFERLLAQLAFDWQHDQLWLVGDLVNRGPDSLGMLRRARELEAELGDRFVSLLGNHELHLLAAAAGMAKKHAPDLDAILAAPDRDELLEWVSRRPLAHWAQGTLLVHAGLWPDWTIADAVAAARQLEMALGDPHQRPFLLRGPNPTAGNAAHALYGLTSLRLCEKDGRACPHKGSPSDAPAGCCPWFALPGRRSQENLVVFGHWAALGLYLGPNVIGLDSGCAWGGFLSALRLEDQVIVQEPNPAIRRRFS